jgi:hypothetical protein
MRVRFTARGERQQARLTAVHREELRRPGPEPRALLAQLEAG